MTGNGASIGQPRTRSGAEQEVSSGMSFCEHCEGQRFDRAQVLRILRATRQKIRTEQTPASAEDVIALAINAIRSLEIPHLELLEDFTDDVVH
jgi:imidazolonepropionase-like amidohydrolase